jgi:hypothetical protein
LYENTQFRIIRQIIEHSAVQLWLHPDPLYGLVAGQRKRPL